MIKYYVSINYKKRDKDNQGASGGGARADYMIREAGGRSDDGTTRDTTKGSTTADKVKRIEEGGDATSREEKTTTSYSRQQQEEQRYAATRALDETKDNIRKTTDEARRDIPRYTQAVNEYQEQTTQASKEMADNYIDAQREIINSFRSVWLPQIEAVNRMFTSSWMSPRNFAETYATLVNSIADNIIAATRLTNNMIFANMETFKNLIQQTKDNTKEFSRIGVNAAKTLEQTSRDVNTTLQTSSNTTSGFSNERAYISKQEQIPSRQNEEETDRTMEAQHQIAGQRRERIVKDLPQAAAVAQILKDLSFPAEKNKVIEFVRQRQQSNNNPDYQKMIPLLEQIEDRRYENVSDVTNEAGLVE
jgi:hypothetical protein